MVLGGLRSMKGLGLDDLFVPIRLHWRHGRGRAGADARLSGDVPEVLSQHGPIVLDGREDAARLGRRPSRLRWHRVFDGPWHLGRGPLGRGALAFVGQRRWHRLPPLLGCKGLLRLWRDCHGRRIGVVRSMRRGHALHAHGSGRLGRVHGAIGHVGVAILSRPRLGRVHLRLRDQVRARPSSGRPRRRSGVVLGLRRRLRRAMTRMEGDAVGERWRGRGRLVG